MRSRHILGAAIFCVTLGTLGGQTVHAQGPSSERFVQLLLMNESALITADSKALSARDTNILKLNAATSSRKIKQLEKTLTCLNRQIVALTLELQVFSSQAFTTASSLTPSNPSLVSNSLANLLTVQSLSAQAGLGIGPATPSQ